MLKKTLLVTTTIAGIMSLSNAQADNYTCQSLCVSNNAYLSVGTDQSGNPADVGALTPAAYPANWVALQTTINADTVDAAWNQCWMEDGKSCSGYKFGDTVNKLTGTTRFSKLINTAPPAPPAPESDPIIVLNPPSPIYMPESPPVVVSNPPSPIYMPEPPPVVVSNSPSDTVGPSLAPALSYPATTR